MNEDKNREAFEQNPRYDFEKDANGYYVHAIVADAFVNFRDGYQAAAKSAWLPIETAPKDGTVVLARIPDRDVQQAVMWSAKDQCWVIQWDHWKLRGLDAPTHWMHLPEVE